jgi:hypothetical protein
MKWKSKSLKDHHSKQYMKRVALKIRLSSQASNLMCLMISIATTMQIRRNLWMKEGKRREIRMQEPLENSKISKVNWTMREKPWTKQWKKKAKKMLRCNNSKILLNRSRNHQLLF